ncbi:MAG: GNAT family N-acetyltransferase [Vulcanimicrobiaceae bacterium]
MDRLEALTPATRAETLAYLARRPYDNVYLAWLIATERAARGDIALWRDASGAVAGACYYGANIVLCAAAPPAIDAFAERSRLARGARMIVGPAPEVERLWSRARAWFPRPRAIRSAQPLYAVERATLLACDPAPGASAARAGAEEVDELARHAARMIAGEIGGDPARVTPDFRGRCARLVAAGWWWRYRVAGELAFTCNLGAGTAQTAQIQGVWTPPEMRGAGHATRGLAAICAGMLRDFPTLSLYVNDYNTRAIALYERVGFRRVGEFRTILVT